MDDKEIAKELAIAIVDKIHFSSGESHSSRLVQEFAEAYKTLYTAVRDVDKD